MFMGRLDGTGILNRKSKSPDSIYYLDTKHAPN